MIEPGPLFLIPPQRHYVRWAPERITVYDDAIVAYDNNNGHLVFSSTSGRVLAPAVDSRRQASAVKVTTALRRAGTPTDIAASAGWSFVQRDGTIRSAGLRTAGLVPTQGPWQSPTAAAVVRIVARSAGSVLSAEFLVSGPRSCSRVLWRKIC